MSAHLLLLLAVLTVAAAVPYAPCNYGQSFVDQCENQCECQAGGGYACSRKACLGAGTAGIPLACEVEGDIRVERNIRYVCENGIVHFKAANGPDTCTPGASWKHRCNTCTCSAPGVVSCTEMACNVLDRKPILAGGDSIPTLEFGDLAIASERPCPTGLQEGVSSLLSKVCRGQGCTPGATWTVNGGCSSCVCTQDGEPACTPCRREPTPDTVTCEGGYRECPADCGQKFNAEKNCYDCPCGVDQKPGDVVVDIDGRCPPGTDFRSAGAFFQTCGLLDHLPKGDTRVCGVDECPADCGLVRYGINEGCVYCQCGPVLAPGDEQIPFDGECRSPLLPGPYHLTTKVCRAPTREECVPDTTYNIKCDVCLCQKDGAPACTKRDCTLPKYGDLQVCDAEYRECPADCGVAGADSYCKHCQCGPRLDKGDIVIGIDEPCPPNFVLKAHQFATKTCKSATSCQYGPAYIDECGNTCKCESSVYGCTRKPCRPGQTSEKPVPCSNPSDLPRLPNTRVICHDGIVKLQALDAACLPGSVFLDKEYCNSCFCSDAGVAGCTLKACIQVPQCQYGPSYIDECGNTCECQNGVYGCTRKACRPGQTQEKPVPCSNAFDLPRVPNRRVICHDGIVKLQTLDATCLRGSVFLDSEYCNSCFCSDTGRAGCTLKACIQVAQCQYGSSYIDECGNTCECQNGVYGCTRKACRSGQTPEKPVPCSNAFDLPRVPNRRVVCHDGIVKLQELDATCLRGSVFLDSEYCNSCFCSETGIAGCTLKACIQAPGKRNPYV